MLPTSTDAMTEVAEQDASRAVKTVYDDIKQTLRVPVVSSIFRVLAINPDFLQLAWRQLKPNMQTIYVERQADEIRRQAVEGFAGLGAAPAASDPAIVSTLKVQHYINPKLSIAILALRGAVNGQYPLLGELPMSEKRQIESGIPEGATAPPPGNDAGLSEATRTVLDEIASTLRIDFVGGDFTVLANWPDYLEAAWTALRAAMQTEGYPTLTRSLRWRMEEAIMSLPFRIEVNPHIMRLCGLNERDIDAIRAALDDRAKLMPDLVASSAFLASGALGGVAADSPFPLKTS